MDDDFNMELSRSKPSKGRRAGKNKSKIEKQISNLDLNENNNNDSKNKPANQKPRNRQMGWGTSDDTKNQKEEIDSRLIQNDDEEETEVLEIIPDLEDLEEENMIQQVANPSQKFNKDIATYRELDVDLMNVASFRTIDDVIDMKCLVNNLNPHLSEEEDQVWRWDKLFADVTSQLKSNKL